VVQKGDWCFGVYRQPTAWDQRQRRRPTGLITLKD
jgi:hypothetical protein